MRTRLIALTAILGIAALVVASVAGAAPGVPAAPQADLQVVGVEVAEATAVVAAGGGGHAGVAAWRRPLRRGPFRGRVTGRRPCPRSRRLRVRGGYVAHGSYRGHSGYIAHGDYRVVGPDAAGLAHVDAALRGGHGGQIILALGPRTGSAAKALRVGRLDNTGRMRPPPGHHPPRAEAPAPPGTFMKTLGNTARNAAVLQLCPGDSGECFANSVDLWLPGSDQGGRQDEGLGDSDSVTVPWRMNTRPLLCCAALSLLASSCSALRSRPPAPVAPASRFEATISSIERADPGSPASLDAQLAFAGFS